MKDKILYLLQDTSRLSEVSKKEILQWLEQYPFYTPLHLLLQKKEEMLKRTGSETPFKSAVYFHNDIDFNALDEDLIVKGNTPVISHELASDDLEDSIEVELSETEEVKYNSESELLLAELETEESVKNIEFTGLAGAGAVVDMDITLPESAESVEKETEEVQIVPLDYTTLGLAGAGSVVNLDITIPEATPVEAEKEEVPELTPLDYSTMGLAGAGDVIENDHVPEYHVEEEIFNIEDSPYENVSLEDADDFIAERELLVADYSDELGFTDAQDQLESLEEPLGTEQVGSDFEVEELLIDSGSHIATNTDDIPADIPEEKTKDFHVAPTVRILSLNDVDADDNVEEDVYIGEVNDEIITESPVVDEAEISRVIEMPEDIDQVASESKKKEKSKKEDKPKKNKKSKSKKKKKKNKSSFTKWLSESKQLKKSEPKSKKKKQKKHKLKEKEIIKEANKSNFRDESIISETLAEILGKQGHFKESIDMYKQLSLLYPEKSAYFALKIEELNKLSK